MVGRASEISIQAADEPFDSHTVNRFTVTKDNKFFLNVIETTSEDMLREWVRGIQSIYGKKNRRNIIVGFSASCSHDSIQGKGENPYNLLQLCVGTECLLLELYTYSPMARVVKEFLYDNRTVLVGVGIEKMVKRLEKEKESERLLIRNRVELREEADKKFPGYKLGKSSLEELAKVVLGGEVDFVKPRNIKWYDHIPVYGRILSQELIKWASVEAFLACRMGSILLKDSL